MELATDLALVYSTLIMKDLLKPARPVFGDCLRMVLDLLPAHLCMPLET